MAGRVAPCPVSVLVAVVVASSLSTAADPPQTPLVGMGRGVAPNREETPLVGLFGTDAPGTANITNAVWDPDPGKLVAEHRRSGRAAFLHLGLIPESVGNSIWNVQCEKLGKCDEGTGCGATVSGLLPGWEAALSGAIRSIGPALANESVRGVFLGDEMCSTVGIPAANLSAVATAAKNAMAAWGGGLVVSNEGIWAVNGTANGPNAKSKFPRPTPCYLPAIPAAIDLFSVDVYVSSAENQPRPGISDAEEARVAKAFYDRYITPKLHAHQRLLLVPGTFADPDVGRSGSIAKQDVVIAQKLRGYVRWLRNDSRVVGINAWKWADDKLANGSWNPSYGAIAVGLASLPRAQSVLAEVAHPNGQS